MLASNNAGKLREFSACSPLGCQVIAQGELERPGSRRTLPPLSKTLAKARHASRLTGLPALADDSGLCVDAPGGAPACCPHALPANPNPTPATTPPCWPRWTGKPAQRPLLRAGAGAPRRRPTTHHRRRRLARPGAQRRARRRRLWLRPAVPGAGRKRVGGANGRRRQNAVSHRGQAMRALAAKLAELGQA